MLAQLRDGSAQTIVRAATLRQELQIQLSTSPQSQYTDTGPTSPTADPITPGAQQGSHWSANLKVTGITRPGKIPSQAGFEPRIFRSPGGRLNPLGQRGGLRRLTPHMIHWATPRSVSCFSSGNTRGIFNSGHKGRSGRGAACPTLKITAYAAHSAGFLNSPPPPPPLPPPPAPTHPPTPTPTSPPRL